MKSLQPVEISPAWQAWRETYSSSVAETNQVLLDKHYLSGLAGSTLASIKYDLASMASIAGFADMYTFPYLLLTTKEVKAFIRKMQTTVRENGKPYALGTILKRAYILRAILREGVHAGVYSEQEFHRVCKVINKLGSSAQSRKSLPQDVVHKLIVACPNDYLGIRDQCILTLMGCLGLRRFEVCALKHEDIRDEELLIMGKGSKERLVPLANGAHAALAGWLRVSRNTEGPLFPGKKGSIQPRAVHNLVLRAGKRAGLPDVRAHDLRRIAASYLLAETGYDYGRVMKLMGWSNPRTVEIYDYRDDAATIEALNTTWSKTTRVLKDRLERM